MQGKEEGGGQWEIWFLSLSSPTLCCFIFQRGARRVLIIQHRDSQLSLLLCSGGPQPFRRWLYTATATSSINHLFGYLNINQVPFWSFYQRKHLQPRNFSSAYCVCLWEKPACGGGGAYDSDLCLYRLNPFITNHSWWHLGSRFRMSEEHQE